MQNVSVALDNTPGALADMGRALGNAGVSVEGGGVFVVDGVGIGHYLFHDGEAARVALEAAGIRVLGVQDVVLLRLRQDEAGQLGKLAQRMADAGVNIEVQYSDHDHQLVLVVDKRDEALRVAELWSKGGAA